MIMQILTLNQLWYRKASNYYHKSRDNNGVPTISFDKCYKNAQEDYPAISGELDTFNNWFSDYWTSMSRRPEIVTWKDGTRDIKRECDDCETLCKIPIHKDMYSEITYIKEKEV